ncbi:hypothetical protein TCAL_08325 [Tigriopus californicus]|uniref:C2H2-type domain-containing protein n=1 Tax=Tigriopus californicus TaxID=6832 RepID=A0A553PCB7_TIGCA|nr:Krueppel homolog 1-like [Tigriopus californicus]TRY75324.1 hypothetical protein TCAL_08325 [Tigriopus californicus]|eukprot:TCALIF_08325-PA protein Name:"Similar to znf367 Zinc finger protein 367 (Danio rerio)" AED:0.02 eAED:0.02 QI:493/1/0.66/1/1/1/3/0/505
MFSGGLSPQRHHSVPNLSDLGTPKRHPSGGYPSSPYPSGSSSPSPNGPMVASSPMSFLHNRDMAPSPLPSSSPFKAPLSNGTHGTGMDVWSSPIQPPRTGSWASPSSGNGPISVQFLDLTPEASSSNFHTPNRSFCSRLNISNNMLDSSKRGRPRADLINHLMIEGSSSPSEIKCKVCHRVFPREKSLQAHLRTHTGERPYTCDYPGCSKRFTQSGQLKTHQRLHAGEKPFVCSAPGCGNRYTHANRQCPIHPLHKPQRSCELVLQPVFGNGEDKEAVLRWLAKYKQEREEKTPGKLQHGEIRVESPFLDIHRSMNVTPLGPTNLGIPKKSKTKRGLVDELEQENFPSACSDNAPPMSPRKMSKSLLEERLVLSPKRKTLSDITPSKSTSNVLKPKKRWIQGIVQQEQEQQQQQQQLQEQRITEDASDALVTHSNVDVLAKPIVWNEEDEEPAQLLSRPNLFVAGEPRRSPKSWMVAKTLVEMKQNWDDNNQPLNLSMDKREVEK